MKRNRGSCDRRSILRQVRCFATGCLLWGTLEAQILPPPSAVPEAGRELPSVVRLFVRGYRYEGNHAFTDAELARVTEPFTGRDLGNEELEQARRLVTQFYIDHGYVNSGAVIPDQDAADGIIVLRIIEGELTRIELRGNKWLRDGYIRSRVRRWSSPPLNLFALSEGLHLLRQNPNVRQINAELKPGIHRGESLLQLQVEDRQPFRIGLQIDNQRPPSVGAEQIWLLVSDLNLTGHSDPLELRYGIAHAGADGLEWSGADNLEGRYLLPITRYDTALGVHGSRLNTSIVEDPFLPLAITSLTTSYGLVLRQPVYQTPNQEAALSVGFDRRENDTRLLGESFSISPGAVDGESVVSVLRLTQEWLFRGLNHVLALRSTFNLGLDAWGATDNGIPGDPNATFFSWLGQAQYIQRLFGTQNQVVLRAAGQWTAEPLLALEQMSVGGFGSVRGYLENQLVRDRGITASVEFRLPVLFDNAGAGTLYVAPFFDWGGAWDVKGSTGPSAIYSTGLGMLFSPNKHVAAEVYWGYRLRHVETPDDAGLQAHGVGFRVKLMAF
jgi:hemolysin activation/secretion protein